MLHMEITVVCENDTKRMNTLCEKNARNMLTFLLNSVVHLVTTAPSMLRKELQIFQNESKKLWFSFKYVCLQPGSSYITR